MPFVSKNPFTEEVFGTFPELTDEDIERKLAIAHATFLEWRFVSFAHRRERMERLGTILREEKRSLGELITREMGKPITQAMAEVEKCAWGCEYYAAEAEQMLTPEKINSDASDSFVRFDPLGVVLAVMPWNFPLWQVLRFAAPAVMAGNVGVLKHASNVPECAQMIEQLFARAGFPEGVFQNLLIGSARVEKVLRDPRVAAATLTGSERAGISIASIAGSEIKKVVLELGGSDPFIVLADANITEAAKVGATARLQNAGQSCIAAKRFIVVESVLEQFVAEFKKQFETFVIGDPMDERTHIGPLVNESSVDELDRQVHESVKKGAEIVIGGKRGEGEGYFYEPTILTGVKSGMPAYSEEFFGPVASVIAVRDEDTAIRVANDTSFGLGSSLWTTDMNKAKMLAAKLEVGGVFINGMVKSDPRLPFGGVKRSGIGRELAHYGIREFVNIKTVWMK